MRRAVLIAMLLMPTQAPAQSLEWANKMFLQNGGKTSHDFGQIPRGVQEHTFTMTNIWAIPVEIISIRTSCGCVAATPSKKVLQPRESAKLVVSMDGTRFTGPKTVSVYIVLGPEYTSTATLTVSANARSDVVLNPGQVAFGVVNAGQSMQQNIDIEYAGALNWMITDVLKGEAPLEVKLEQRQRNFGQFGGANQIGYRLIVTLKPNAPAGNHHWEINLKTNDPASPLVAVLVEANIRASLDVVPATVSLGNPTPGNLIERKIVVRGNKPFRIESVAGVSDELKVDFPTAEAPVHVVTVKCQPTTLGEFRRQLQIKTNYEGESVVSVTIVGTVTP
ncbi:MAG: DUF1573 domain-containing protein [Gemmataceae bacterium]